MANCPACSQGHGVNPVVAWSSSALFPATCKRCGGRFHPESTASTILAELVFIPFGLGVAFASPGAAAPLLIVAYAIALLLLRGVVPLVCAK